MSTSQELKVIYKQPESLHDYPGNARTHTKAQIRKIASSIRAFGFTNPVLIDPYMLNGQQAILTTRVSR